MRNSVPSLELGPGTRPENEGGAGANDLMQVARHRKNQQPVSAMPIVVNLDVMLARRKMKLNDLAEAVGITPQNLSVLKTGKAKAIRFSTLEAICRHLDCQPGDILEFQPPESDESLD